MALVAYGSSDDSGEESENEQESTKPSVKSDQSSKKQSGDAGTSTNGVKETSSENSNTEKSGKTGLLSKLPTPTSHTALLLDVSSALPSKDKKGNLKRGPVKITVPSLSQFEDDDEPRPKKRIQPSSTKSGLFALLPAPKNVTMKEAKRSLIPNVLTKKPVAPPIKKPQPIPKAVAKTSLTSYQDSDPESDGEGDFFSLNKEDKLPDIPVPEIDQTYNNVQNYNYEEEQVLVQQPQEIPEEAENYVQPKREYVPNSVDDLQLDDEALQKLCGRKSLRKREEVQIVDLDGDSIRPDQNEWLTKQLTEEQPSYKGKKVGGPSSMQKRKHQITYLAAVAKANEIELKNTWANNRQTRRQTQSRYGF